ncbi:MAG: serine protease [Sphingomonas bacterium]|uniref:signal peptide peptidase SppA n=1 Tax=Sphingomonas bacterium TaxID=1895847 RepID=UPI002615BFFF|nr:signal peptide peptidase SppA [Sphingomonas bacterium]MDB5695354.1 serine protease [Sphingomonas bacterium]
MKLVRGAWKLLVGIKDGLVLVAMLLFFGILFAALSARPGGKAIGDGALVLKLDGAVVEQPSETDTFASLSGQPTAREYRLRDVIRAIDAARTDDRVKAIVLDLDAFGGGYPAVISELSRAVKRARDGADGAKGKPVLAYATAYDDAAYRLAANASEIWMHPMGGTLFAGPGGSQLYYKGLIDRLGVNAHVYRVGKYKSFVEPYTRADQSPESREASQALYSTLFGQWQEGVRAARPKAQFAAYLTQPAQVVQTTGGDIAEGNLRAGIVDKLGDRTAFGRRVAALAGGNDAKPAGYFNAIRYADWIAAHPLSTDGDAIGVLTVAGDIVDGKAGPGTAGGETIARAMLDGLATKDLKALVVRVDTGGGSALASEQIRLAVLEARKRKLPVVISMGGLAASGGYWVATAGDTIFAEPNTITGSIGIFGILPTFERSLAKIGVTSDGVKTTPLSGQPDVIAGTNPVLDAVLQSGIENGYRQFLSRVAAARKMTPERVDQIGQGRVWDGGTAHQLRLVDRFGGLSDAVAEAAKRAGLKADGYHTVYLEKEPDWLAQLAATFAEDEEDAESGAGGDVFAQAASAQRQLLARAVGDVRRLVAGGSIQARCLQCAGFGPTTAAPNDARLFDVLLARLGW